MLNYSFFTFFVPFASFDIYSSLKLERFLKFGEFCTSSQKNIINLLETEEKEALFRQQEWKRESGHGITAVLEGGKIWEKAAVSTTITSGTLSADRAKHISARGIAQVKEGTKYYAAALSLVLHSRSPMVPTFRSDVRYFQVGDDGESGWFGGGADITPYYLFDDDATEFHSYYQNICKTRSPYLYNHLKKWCDDYFYLPSRDEHRGVGGIFFDDLVTVHMINSSHFNYSTTNTLNSINISPLDEAMDFAMDVCNGFMPSYLPIVKKRKDLLYSESQRHFQLLRRGRYVEFNLLYDRGVKFGLVPGGRVEAVLVSCPPLVAWDYEYVPTPGGE